MSILDLLKEIPLSAVLRERLVAEEAKTKEFQLRAEKAEVRAEKAEAKIVLLEARLQNQDAEIKRLQDELDECKRGKPRAFVNVPLVRR